MLINSWNSFVFNGLRRFKIDLDNNGDYWEAVLCQLEISCSCCWVPTTWVQFWINSYRLSYFQVSWRKLGTWVLKTEGLRWLYDTPFTPRSFWRSMDPRSNIWSNHSLCAKHGQRINNPRFYISFLCIPCHRNEIKYIL